MTLGNLLAILVNRGVDPTTVKFKNEMILGPKNSFTPSSWDGTKAHGKISTGKWAEFYVFADAVSEDSWTCDEVEKRKAGDPVRLEDVHPQEHYLIECTKYYPGRLYRNWWGKNRTGYTFSVDDAGSYEGVKLKECSLNAGNYKLWLEREVLRGDAGKVTRCVRIP